MLCIKLKAQPYSWAPGGEITMKSRGNFKQTVSIYDNAMIYDGNKPS